jgi:CheY-like chemotaxis protein
MESASQELTVTLPPQPVYLNADSVRLTQLFSNLLSNASKYTPPHGHIWLTAEQQGTEVVVSVKDTGLGIPPDMLDKIFDLFMQVDHSLERTRGGLGIGLTLVRHLVEMHGGSVHAHSEGPRRGSEFVVRLPRMLETPPPQLPKSVGTQATIAMGRRILVVDDNRDSADSLVMLLRMSGNEVHVAYDGLEAIEAAANLRPDVILLDIGLPRLNGYETAHRIREQPWGKDMMLVAATGWGQDEDRQKSTAAGFNAHLVKPVDQDALTTLLRNAPLTGD